MSAPGCRWILTRAFLPFRPSLCIWRPPETSMDHQDNGSKEKPEWAAGGIVWRRDAKEPKIAVVHRPKYNDWALPKGHAETGEDMVSAALREAQEETRLKASIGSLAGCYCYAKSSRMKIVILWHMDGLP